ncbi:MAG: hypothetical protein KF699_13565 [Phycisphaeraceae bacterium]|nr:hypothetical protein [Phycisphaeraceae bacterium]
MKRLVHAAPDGEMHLCVDSSQAVIEVARKRAIIVPMQVLGDLVKLSVQEDPSGLLPVPWWHRAPLGLHSNTPVYIAITASSGDGSGPDDRPGDLLLSVLDPNTWHDLALLTCSTSDKPGLLTKAFAIVPPLNIALAEAATMVEHRQDGKVQRIHQVTVVCEPRGATKSAMEHRDRVEAAMRDQGWTTRMEQMDMPLVSHPVDIGQVVNGWAVCKWWRLVEKQGARFPEFDFTRAVVSADTDRRFVRYVFPRRGTHTVQVEHRDSPGALEALTAALAAAGLNVLSALLRRGGAKHGNAVLVAVCEPPNGYDGSIGEIIRSALATVDGAFRVFPPGRSDIHDGRPAESTIYLSHPEEPIAKLDRDMLQLVRQAKKRLPQGLCPIFLSRRFFKNCPRTARLALEIKEVLRLNGCVAVEGEEQVSGLKPPFWYITEQMWNSRGAIILLAKSSDQSEASVVPNLAHELGFFQGQGKPLLILEEVGLDADLLKFSNIAGANKPRFDASDEAFDHSNRFSLRSRIEKWLNDWKR